MSPEIKSAHQLGPYTLICEPWETQDVDFVNRYHFLGRKRQTNNGGGTVNPLWQDTEDGISHLDGVVFLSRWLAAKYPGIGAEDSISVRQLCGLRLDLGRGKIPKLSYQKLARYLIWRIVSGKVTIRDANASIGMTVLRGGFTSA